MFVTTSVTSACAGLLSRPYLKRLRVVLTLFLPDQLQRQILVRRQFLVDRKRLTNPGMRSAASGRAASGSEVGNLAEGASIQAWEHVREIFLHGRA